MKHIALVFFVFALGCSSSSNNALDLGDASNENNENDMGVSDASADAPDVSITCDETTCENGSCDAGSCVCDDGYAGATCSICAEGFQDNDANFTCEPSCDGFDCGGGRCVDDDGLRFCFCDEGFAGARCESCDTGLQDNDMNGTCEPDCSEFACPDISTCDDAAGIPQCGCPVGTEFNVDETFCELSVPADPDFDGVGWTPYGDAVLDPVNSAARFSETANCQTASGVSQSYTLADFDVIGPIGADLTFTLSELCSNGNCRPGETAPSFRFGNSVQFAKRGRFRDEGTQDRFVCLGESAHGVVDLAITTGGAPDATNCGFDYQGVETIDRFEFRRTDPALLECPIRFRTLNPEFNALGGADDVPGWETSAFSNSEVRIVTEAGNNLLYLRQAERCDSASASSLLNVPQISGGAAVRFDYRATLGEGSSFGFLSQRTFLRTTPTLAEFKTCLPEFVHGTVVDVFLAASASGSGLCSDQIDRELWADNFEVVPDSDCETVDGFINGDFDLNATGWNFGRPGFGSFTFSDINGNRVLAMKGALGAAEGISQPVYFSDPNVFNAVDVTYRKSDEPFVTSRMNFASIRGLAFFRSRNLPATNGNFVTETICIPPESFGYAFNVTLRHTPSSGTIGTQPDDPLEVDTIKLVNAVCP